MSGVACPRRCWAALESWAANNLNTLRALIKALIEACLWLDEPANRSEAARILSSPRYLNTPAEIMARTLDLPGFHVFQRDAANFPWRSHADWFLAQMVRWKQAPADTDIKAVADCASTSGAPWPRLDVEPLEPGRCCRRWPRRTASDAHNRLPRLLLQETSMSSTKFRTTQHPQRRHRHGGADGLGAPSLPAGRLRAGRWP